MQLIGCIENIIATFRWHFKCNFSVAWYNLLIAQKRAFENARKWGIFMYFYQRIKDLREDADKTQIEIAELLGTVRQQYAKYESGVQELPMHHFITLARYYNVSLDYLAGLTNEPRRLR